MTILPKSSKFLKFKIHMQFKIKAKGIVAKRLSTNQNQKIVYTNRESKNGHKVQL